MYEEIVCALSTESATEVQDFQFDPPEDDPHEKLKEQLIAWIADMEHQKLLQLLRVQELEDRKPSQLLQKMQLVLREKAKIIDSSLLRDFFATTPV